MIWICLSKLFRNFKPIFYTMENFYAMENIVLIEQSCVNLIISVIDKSMCKCKDFCVD